MNKYEQIAFELRDEIRHQIYPAGEKMPSEEELAKRFSTSRVTMSRALSILKDQGWIIIRPGSGIYARQNETDIDVQVSWYAGLKDRLKDSDVSSNIISFDIRTAEEDECERLELKKNAKIYDIIRQRIVDGKPFALEYTIMPVRLIPGINENVLHASVYGYIQNELHLTIGNARRRIHADKPDAYDIQYLDCTKDTPVLEIEQVVTLSNGKPFEYSQSRFRYDRTAIIYNSRG